MGGGKPILVWPVLRHVGAVCDIGPRCIPRVPTRRMPRVESSDACSASESQTWTTSLRTVLVCVGVPVSKDASERAQGARLQAFFTGLWSQALIVHHCRVGCPCGETRAGAVTYGLSLIEAAVLRRLPVPAANRWLHIFPVVAMLTLSLFLHKIFLRAFLELGEVDGPDLIRKQLTPFPM